MNHGQKKIRSIEPIAAGTTPLVINQIPTPVIAPMLVIIMMTGLVADLAKSSHSADR